MRFLLLPLCAEEYDFYTSVDEIVDNSIQSTLGCERRLISIDRVVFKAEGTRGKQYFLAISDNGKGSCFGFLSSTQTHTHSLLVCFVCVYLCVFACV